MALSISVAPLPSPRGGSVAHRMPFLSFCQRVCPFLRSCPPSANLHKTRNFVQNCFGYKVAELLAPNRSVSVSSFSENFLDGLPETWYHKDVANGIPFIQVKTGAERKALRPFFLHGITVLRQCQTLFLEFFDNFLSDYLGKLLYF